MNSSADSLSFLLQLADLVENIFTITDRTGDTIKRFPLTLVKEILSRKCGNLFLGETNSLISIVDAEHLLQVRSSIRLY